MKKTLTLVIAAASFGLVAENKVAPPAKDTKVAVGKKVQLVMDKKQLEKEKLAAELLELSDVPKNIQQVKTQIQSMQDRMLARMKDKTDAKKIAAYKQNTAKLINDSLDWNKIKVDFVKLYTKNYSAEDMKGIIAFYKTAAGKKMLEQKQNMMRQEMMVMQSQFRKIMPQLRKMQMELRGQDKSRSRAVKRDIKRPKHPAAKAPEKVVKSTQHRRTPVTTPDRIIRVKNVNDIQRYGFTPKFIKEYNNLTEPLKEGDVIKVPNARLMLKLDVKDNALEVLVGSKVLRKYGILAMHPQLPLNSIHNGYESKGLKLDEKKYGDGWLNLGNGWGIHGEGSDLGGVRLKNKDIKELQSFVNRNIPIKVEKPSKK